MKLLSAVRVKRSTGLGMDDPTQLILHCFGMPGATEREFICTPNKQGTGFVVDTVTYEEGDLVRSGPLEGKRTLISTPDSDPEI